MWVYLLAIVAVPVCLGIISRAIESYGLAEEIRESEIIRFRDREAA